jgi:hypothetical protein
MKANVDIAASLRNEERDHKAALRFAIGGGAVFYAVLGYYAVTQGPTVLRNIRQSISHHFSAGSNSPAQTPAAIVEK